MNELTKNISTPIFTPGVSSTIACRMEATLSLYVVLKGGMRTLKLLWKIYYEIKSHVRPLKNRAVNRNIANRRS